jgi:hypothetical protein
MKYYAIAVLFAIILATATGLQFLSYPGGTKTITQTEIPSTSYTTVTTKSVIANATGSTSISTAINNTLKFSQSSALNYFASLNTSTGLLSDFHGDSIIYLSDDQPLDYNALLDIHASTGNALALRLANQINGTMTRDYGSLYRYWNEVYVLYGRYPSVYTWNTTGGINQLVSSNNEGFRVLSTVFPADQNNGVELQQYVDLALYYAVWNAKVASMGSSGGNLTSAAGTFGAVQSDCANYGCLDSANVGGARAYQSYKVALDLIAYKELQVAGAFRSTSGDEMAYMNETINRLLYVAVNFRLQMEEFTHSTT